MPQPLPDRFTPASLIGPRAMAFERREDKYQQLVGDAMQALCGGTAHVAPTRGADGSIDAYIDADVEAFTNHFGIPTPAIVEAKDHDDQVPAGNLDRNIDQMWRAVSKKLRNQAETGWPKLFAPWREARSYVYCVSAHLPHQEARRDLQDRISAFFRELPADKRPPIESVRVVDWSDLRALADRFPRLLDNWMGSGAPSIKPLPEYEASLTRFLEFLSEKRLPFVPPSKHFDYHPDNLLAALDVRRSSRGIVLLGAGGIGKTRTALEVARRAQARGDRVLWVSPGEPPVTATTLGQVVGARSGNVLLVLDYVEQMYTVDWPTFRRDVLGGLLAQGSHVSVLGNARSAWMGHEENAQAGMFDPVRLVPTDAQRTEVQSGIVRHAAPSVAAAWGFDRAREICGERPIIALLIARELERLAASGELSTIDPTQLRNGDLLHWLKRRLDSDHIRVRAADSPWVAATPSTELVLVAGLVALAPLHQDQLSAAGYRMDGERPDSLTRVHHILRQLLEMGWLESRDDQLTTPHDVVADQVLDDVLFDRRTVRLEPLKRIVASAAVHVRNLGRLAVSLDRLHGSEPTERATALRDAIARSISDTGEAVQAAARSAGADATSYALGAAISSSAMADARDLLWSTTIAPWLEQYADRLEARHLMHRGLKLPMADGIGRLVSSARTWLGSHGALPEAGFVLDPLLGRTDLAAADASDAIARARTWLGSHGALPEAGFVLNPLLGRTDLAAADASDAIARARTWLGSHGALPEAQFVLNPLLGRTDLAAADASDAIVKSLDWLGEFAAANDSEFVLKALLSREDLDSATFSRAAHAATTRLEVAVDAPDATFILRTCLQAERQLDDSTARAVSERGVKWLRRYPNHPDADYVFNPLLRSRRVSDEIWQSVAAVAVAWLKQERADAIQTRALNSLLMRHSLHPREQSDALVAKAVDLLRRSQAGERDLYLLSTIQRIGLPGEDQAELSRLRSESIAKSQLSKFEHLTRRLREMALELDADLSAIADACAATERMSRRSPASAAYAIGPLVCLAAGTERLADVMKISRAILEDKKLRPNVRGAVLRDILGLSKLTGRLTPAMLSTILYEIGFRDE